MGIRPLARAVLVAFLRIAPLRALEPLRRRYAHATATRAGTLARALELISYRPVEPRVRDFEVIGSAGVRMANDGSHIARQAYWLGRRGYECSEVGLWEEYCAKATSILELGANVGYFSMHGALANPEARYRAVEPNPASAASVRRNIELNRISNATVLECAVVGERTTDTMKLYLPDQERESSATGAFLAGGESIERPAERWIEVEVVEAADLFDGVDLVKLDIEGYEHVVLGAVLERLVTSRPTIFVEMRRNTTRLRSLLSELVERAGYTVHALAPSGLEPIDPRDLPTIVLQDEHNTRDVVLLPPGAPNITSELTRRAA